MEKIATAEKICKNCDQTFTKNYCNECGQKDTHRISIGHLAHDAMHVTLHADKGIFPYIAWLVVSPGVVARGYIDGKRKIFNPLQFLLMSIGLVILMMALTHFYEHVEEMQKQNTASVPDVEVQLKKLEGFNVFIQKNTNLLALLLLPIFAFFGNLLFRKRNDNYAEHIMISVFAISLSNVLTIFVLGIAYFTKMDLTMVTIATFFVTLSSFFLTYKQCYALNWLQAVWKTLVVYSGTMLVYFMLILALTIGILAFG
jgi:hypothetical protein